MKTIVYLLLSAFAFVSCVDYTDETRYDERDRIVGRYEVEEYSTTYDDHLYYDMYLSKDRSSRSLIYLDDFYLENLRVYADLDDDYISIPFQIVDGYEIEGSGYLYHGDLHLNYKVRDRYENAYPEYFETVAYPY
jgi:hypothetical protein